MSTQQDSLTAAPSVQPDHPNPCDLDEYLPWACRQLLCDFTLTVIKITQTEYVSVAAVSKKAINRTKSRMIKMIQSSSDNTSFMKDDKMLQSVLSDDENVIKIFAIYNQQDHLVELKFDKHNKLPRILFQILGLLVQFQKHLVTITVHQGMDVYGLYEITKFLPTCNVTDLCFEGTYLKGGSYGILFENITLIKRISLSRCRIDDSVVETIASKLVYPLPASKTLVVLDLSTNRITDVGAKHIAHALRTNRCLSYLNLSDNRLTDIGGEMLFGSLMTFQLTKEEIGFKKRNLMNYLIKRNELTDNIVKELRIEQSKGKRKSVKPIMKPQIPKKGKGLEKEGSLKAISNDKFSSEIDTYLYERACLLAEVQLGGYSDPFSRNNLVTKGDIVYCLGNNTLCYLNLSYNN